MTKKMIALTVALALTLGLSTIAYAKDNSTTVTNQPVKLQAFQKNELRKASNSNTMYSIMEKYGYEDMVKAMQSGDYASMNKFMNSLSDEDYKTMIELMKKYGYGSMASMMESIGKDNMINMHNSMMGSGNYDGSGN